MTAFATEERLYTIDEYLEMEERSRDKHEYYNGKIIAMAGAHHIHNQIALNIGAALVYGLLGKKFVVYGSDMKIFIPEVETFVYPDAVVVCNKAELYNKRTDTIINPLLVVEIASPSTAKYDRTQKFWRYQSISSFKEYVIVEQDIPWVKSFYKTEEHTWVDTEAKQLNQSLLLQSVGCNIDMKMIYNGVQFEKRAG